MGLKTTLLKKDPIKTYLDTKKQNDRYFKSKHMHTIDHRNDISLKRSTSDIANEFYAEHLENKHRHSASVTNLNTLNMGVKSSTESFTNAKFSGRSSRIT